MKAMNTSPATRVLVIFLIVFASANANAYVGPGLGLGVLGVLLGGIAAVLLAVVGIVWYPAKRLLKKSRAARNEADESDAEDPVKKGEDEDTNKSEGESENSNSK